MFNAESKRWVVGIFLMLATLLVTTPLAHAGLYLQYAVNYNSSTSEITAEPTEFGRMNNMFTIGAAFDKKQKFFFTWEAHSWSKTVTKGTSDTSSELTLMEYGPKLVCYITQTRSWFFSAGWHPYASGTRTIGGVSHDVTGTAMFFSIGYHIDVSKRFALGASVNYHTITISKQVVSTTESDVSNTYGNIYPMLEMVIKL
jgi:hypothetical protein